MKIDLDDKTDVLTYHKKLIAEALKEKEDLKTNVENWRNSSKNLNRLLNTQMSANDKSGLGYAEGMHIVPPPMTWNYMPSGPNVEIDYSKFNYGPKQTLADESDSKPVENASSESDSSIEPSTAPQLDCDDLEQINDDDLEKIDFKWQVAMISMRIKKFHKRTCRKLQFDTRDIVGFDKTKVECFNFHKIGYFARDYRAKWNQDSRRRDGGYNENKARDNSKRPASHDDLKALVTIDGEAIDWSRHVEEDTQNFALMAYSSSNSGSDNETLADESDSKPVENASSESDSSIEPSTSMPEPVVNESKVVSEPKVVCEPKVWTDAPIIKDYESDSDDDLMINV
nr:ribonuclease H-like domain-containing protein [Tanacetum cinerariifolium]